MTHYMNLASLPFEQIVSGAKTIELRLYDEKRQAVSEGDTIIFTNLADNRQITVRVIRLHIFDTFIELYRNLPLSKCGYTEQELFSADLVRKGKNGGSYDTFRNRLVFPVIDVRGNVTGFSGRIIGDGEPKYLNTKDQ